MPVERAVLAANPDCLFRNGLDRMQAAATCITGLPGCPRNLRKEPT